MRECAYETHGKGNRYPFCNCAHYMFFVPGIIGCPLSYIFTYMHKEFRLKTYLKKIALPSKASSDIPANINVIIQDIKQHPLMAIL